MATWEVWRQDDNGVRYRIDGYADRIEALARLLVLEAGLAHKQLYWVDGSSTPQFQTLADAYPLLSATAERATSHGRTLTEFLTGWRLIGRAQANLPELDIDMFVAMMVAATRITPRTVESPAGSEWEKVLLAQLADLREFASIGPAINAYAHFGVRAPASAWRGTGSHWFNFDILSYVECGVAGFIADRSPDLTRLTWRDLADLARCGQLYE
jgi:hypothetical protein